MDWDACIICRKRTSEVLSCPQDRLNYDANKAYSDFLTNVGEFRELDDLPVEIDYGSNGTPEIFIDKRASWHRTCHQKFNNAKLERAKNRKRKQDMQPDESSRHSKRQSAGSSSSKSCIFCGIDNMFKVHEYSSDSAELSLRHMAAEMQDTELIAKISGGDLVAIDAKYHMMCLTQYRNKYRAYIRKQNPLPNSEREQSKAVAFVELVSGIEQSIEEGSSIFKLTELHHTYESRLMTLGQDISINKSRLKEKLLDHFADNGMQEQFDGKNTVLVFPDGMQRMLQDAFLHRNYEEEAFLFAKVSKICREELFKEERSKFCGKFSPQCQEQSCVPSINLLTSNILYGPNVKDNVSFNSQPCLTISQLFTHNCKKRAKETTTNKRHSQEREPPLPVYIGMNIHTLTRNKKLIDELAVLGISIKYDRIIQLENSLAVSMCKQFAIENLVCPSNLRKGIFMVGALDNLDYNPSSTTSQGSFHGTSISVIQFPTKENPGICRNIVAFDPANKTEKPSLPASYTIVPAVSIKSSSTIVPIVNTTDFVGNLMQANDTEKAWVNHAITLLQEETLVLGQAVSWAAYHASHQPAQLDIPSIIASLPLFLEKADSPAMVKHGMNIMMTSTEYLNPGQIPVLACDCPIFAMCKYIQWSWPATHGEQKIVIMFGGLHLEKGLWNTLGDFLDSSGWTVALTEAKVATCGTADSFLKASHITRTRHAHQLTVLALSQLQQDAYESRDARDDTDSFDNWRMGMIEKSPTFQYWDIVLRVEIMILIFIRAHREKNFTLFVECLEALMFLFFALDHYNYSRWVSIHLRDMKSLPAAVKVELSKYWVVPKTSTSFSALPIDQTHEQQNSKVKGKGGAVGLTENPIAFQRWMISGPEQARLLAEFESCYLADEDPEVNYQHHEEGLSTQQSFHRQAKSLIQTIKGYGNPFEDDCPELLVMHTRYCADESVVSTVRRIEALGVEQYEHFKKEVLVDRSKSIHVAIKKNSLPLFKAPKPKLKPKNSQLAAIRNDVSLFARLYIANQKRDGDPAVFFAHENQVYPPSLSDFGKLRSGKKSDLLKCLDSAGQPEIPPHFDVKIIDGAALVHILSTASSSTFDGYAKTVFVPFLLNELQKVNRVDIVWDTYFPNSLKQGTRDRRGSGVRVKVNPQTKMPHKWKDFLLDAKNKEELFSLLSKQVSKEVCPQDKEIYITDGTSVITKGNGQHMNDCTHEEADTRIVVHLVHALETGRRNVVVSTVDTDIVVILIGHFFKLIERFPELNLWVAFGTGKDFSHYNINSMCRNLGKDMSYGLPIFHAFSGCDTTSAFFRKGKKSAWETWKCYPDATDAFIFMHDNPFAPVDPTMSHFQHLERLTVLMYDKTSILTSVNDARRDLFSKKTQSLDNIPPTQDALVQHVKRSVYQSSIWTTSQEAQPVIPTPDGWGWKMQNDCWQPVWMTLPQAAKACSELINCSCKSEHGCVRCKCARANLSCTELCRCMCQK